MTLPRHVYWKDAEGVEHNAPWVAEPTRAAPSIVVPADDRMPADAAYKLARSGTGLLWTGDYHNARHLMQALDRRLTRSEARQAPQSHAQTRENAPPRGDSDLRSTFLQQRKAQAQRAQVLGMILLHVAPRHHIPLRRAPNVQEACEQALGPRPDHGYVMPLRHLLGIVGAHEWRKVGVPIHALEGRRIHAHYGVFAPVRGEYIDLVAQAPLPPACRVDGGVAWDIGTGTGVLAAVLGQRGVHRVIGTDLSDAAVACARENITRLGLDANVSIRQGDMFPVSGEADLIVCNPPWLPGTPSSVLEQAVYDPDNQMLRSFAQDLAARLRPQGEGWLILSDLAERLHVRSREWLEDLLKTSNLRVLDRLDTRPTHKKTTDALDPVHAARASEVTSLWRLGRMVS